MPDLNFSHCGRYPRAYQTIFLWFQENAPGWVGLILGILLNSELGKGGSLDIQFLRQGGV